MEIWQIYEEEKWIINYLKEWKKSKLQITSLLNLYFLIKIPLFSRSHDSFHSSIKFFYLFAVYFPALSCKYYVFKYAMTKCEHRKLFVFACLQFASCFFALLFFIFVLLFFCLLLHYNYNKCTTNDRVLESNENIVNAVTRCVCAIWDECWYVYTSMKCFQRSVLFSYHLKQK